MTMILDKQRIDPKLDVKMDATPAPNAVGTREMAEGSEDAFGLRVQTTRFGIIEVDPDLILNFSEGLIGFERCQRYIVLRQDETNIFRWLQSLDDPKIAFPIVEPDAFHPDYRPTISDADARTLELERDTPILLFSVVTVPSGNPRNMTANLLGPLVVNALTRMAKQVIVQDEGYTTRHRVMDELLQRATGSVSPPALVMVPKAA